MKAHIKYLCLIAASSAVGIGANELRAADSEPDLCEFTVCNVDSGRCFTTTNMYECNDKTGECIDKEC